MKFSIIQTPKYINCCAFFPLLKMISNNGAGTMVWRAPATQKGFIVLLKLLFNYKYSLEPKKYKAGQNFKNLIQIARTQYLCLSTL